MGFKYKFHLLGTADGEILIDVHLLTHLCTIRGVAQNMKAVFKSEHNSVYLRQQVLLHSKRTARLYLVEEYSFKGYSH